GTNFVTSPGPSTSRSRLRGSRSSDSPCPTAHGRKPRATHWLPPGWAPPPRPTTAPRPPSECLAGSQPGPHDYVHRPPSRSAKRVGATISPGHTFGVDASRRTPQLQRGGAHPGAPRDLSSTVRSCVDNDAG